jgi:hypothetical protein
MRLHTDTLAESDLRSALKSSGLAGEGVAIDLLVPYGSRKRARGYEVHLAAHPGTDRFGKNRRAANTGHSGADSETYRKAATYDEWGVFISALYKLDATMVFGPYKDSDDFHTQTEGKF